MSSLDKDKISRLVSDAMGERSLRQITEVAFSHSLLADLRSGDYVDLKAHTVARVARWVGVDPGELYLPVEQMEAEPA